MIPTVGRAHRSGNDMPCAETPRREFIGDLSGGGYTADDPTQVVTRHVAGLGRQLIGWPDRDRAP